MKTKIAIISIFLFAFIHTGLSVELERKIIIEDGIYYYTTVDDNHQMTTLYKGEVNKALKFARPFAVPVGRGISAQTNPLAWDISMNHLYAVNFIDHSLNDRNEAIKKIPLAEIQPWSTDENNVEKLIMQSVDYPMYTINQPYLNTIKKSIYLNHFYFDGRVVDNTYWMVISNNGILNVWNYQGNQWKQLESLELELTNYFSLITVDNKLYFISESCEIYPITKNGIDGELKKVADTELKQSILVEDRDNDKVYLLNKNTIDFEKSLKEIIERSGNLILS